MRPQRPEGNGPSRPLLAVLAGLGGVTASVCLWRALGAQAPSESVLAPLPLAILGLGLVLTALLALTIRAWQIAVWRQCQMESANRALVKEIAE